mmetsp:Transcript_42189/g.71396  ORF Transcript_42189/g.71396 Transcript_42189/m.71396 type:complete len:210 (-) Transcript_42189:661-1290(-)
MTLACSRTSVCCIIGFVNPRHLQLIFHLDLTSSSLGAMFLSCGALQAPLCSDGTQPRTSFHMTFHCLTTICGRIYCPVRPRARRNARVSIWPESHTMIMCLIAVGLYVFGQQALSCEVALQKAPQHIHEAQRQGWRWAAATFLPSRGCERHRAAHMQRRGRAIFLTGILPTSVTRYPLWGGVMMAKMNSTTIQVLSRAPRNHPFSGSRG